MAMRQPMYLLQRTRTIALACSILLCEGAVEGDRTHT